MKKNKMYYKFLLMSSLLTTDFITGIRVVYMLSFFISEGEITVLKGLYSLVIALAEIPTGIISDKISKKLSLQISALLFTTHAIFYIAMPNFMGFFITQFVLALSSAFLSGADAGYIDDYIKEYTNDKYIDVIGRINFVGSFVSAILYLSSGFTYNYNSKLNFIISAILGIIVFLIVTSFPQIKKTNSDKLVSGNTLVDYIKDVKDILIYTLKSKNVLKVTIVSSIIIALLIFNFEYYQIVLTRFNFPNQFLGVLYASFMVMSGIGAKISKYLVNKMNIDIIATLFIILISASYIIFGISSSLILILIAVINQQICFGSWNVISQNEILEHIPTEETKSTMLSMNSLIVSLFRSILVLILGMILSIKGYTFTYFVMVVIMLLTAIILLSLGKNHKKI